jgi:hypothetical protein
MNYYLIVTFSFSILIAGIIGLFRFTKIQKSYYPFLFFVWLGTLNEIVSFLIVQHGGKSIVNNNIYVLLEALVILYFFQMNQFLKKWVTVTASILFIVGWAIELFFIRNLHEVGIYFRIGYSFVIVLISIETINKILVTGEKQLLKSSMFLICVAFICYFTYKVLINTFWLYGLSKSMHFLSIIYSILIFINLFTNLIYALATLWIPRKPLSLLQS